MLFWILQPVMVNAEMGVMDRIDSSLHMQLVKNTLSALCRWQFASLPVMDKHYNDVIMTTIASQITSLTVVYSTVYSDADQRKHQSSASLAFVWGIHRDRWPVNSPHKGPVTRKMFHLMTSSWTLETSGNRAWQRVNNHSLLSKMIKRSNEIFPGSS